MIFVKLYFWDKSQLFNHWYISRLQIFLSSPFQDFYNFHISVLHLWCVSAACVSASGETGVLRQESGLAVHMIVVNLFDICDFFIFVIFVAPFMSAQCSRQDKVNHVAVELCGLSHICLIFVWYLCGSYETRLLSFIFARLCQPDSGETRIWKQKSGLARSCKACPDTHSLKLEKFSQFHKVHSFSVKAQTHPHSNWRHFHNFTDFTVFGSKLETLSSQNIFPLYLRFHSFWSKLQTQPHSNWNKMKYIQFTLIFTL